MLAASPNLAGSDLKGIWAFVNADDKNKSEKLVEASKLEFTNRKTLAIPTAEGTKEYSFTPYSFDQFSGMLKIPTKYLESCPVGGPGGMKAQIDLRLAERGNKEQLVRFRNTDTVEGVSGVIRAVLPGLFTPFDNRHLLTAVQRANQEAGGGFQLELTNAHDPRSMEQVFHLRFLRQTGFNFDGIGIDDPHRIGYHCFTSEVGYSDLVLNALVWRLVCKNGMMGFGDSEVLKIRHRNFASHEVTPRLQEGVLSAVRQEAAVKELLERKYTEPVRDFEGELLLLGAKTKVSDFIKERAVEIARTHKKEEYSRFDVMQAYTEAAQSLPIDDRVKLELTIGRAIFGAGAMVRSRRNVPETIDTDGEIVNPEN
jgi:hypothetical protein